jgi:cytochrome c-type biogenesis protein CcmH
MFLAASLAFAIEPEEQLGDPVLEARARALGRELRCLVCDNETIDASQAPLAADVRKLVRQEILAGRSDAQIRDMLRERYGDYVLFRPRFGVRTLILWLGPFALLLLAGGVLLIRARRADFEPSPALSAEEEAAVAGLLEEPESGPQSRLTKN